jgi:hypothetical protein
MVMRVGVLLAALLLPCAANAQGYQSYPYAQAPQFPQIPNRTQPAFNPYPAQPQTYVPNYLPQQQRTNGNCTWIGTFFFCNTR